MNNIKDAYKKGYRYIGDNKIKSHIGNILKQRIGSTGYLVFNFKLSSGKQSNILYHRLAAYQKYGNKMFEPGIVVRHKNGNKLDNSFYNILIGTHSQNQYDRPKKDRLEHAIRASSFNRKFSDKEVKEIIELHNEGWSYNKLKEKYNVAKSTLSYLFNKAQYTKNITLTNN